MRWRETRNPSNPLKGKSSMKAVDVMGFAGSMLAGVDQAGFDVVAKREPDAFKGFGVASVQYNAPWIEAQVSKPADWDLPAESDIDLVYGCPPCSGFSQLSAMNVKIYEHTGTTYRGADAEINECMQWLNDYAARVKPRVVIMESVGPAFKLGRAWMESLWEGLRKASGLPYKLAHVNMDARWVGGDVHRPRYFYVAHLDPFGIGLEFVKPRTMMEVIGDLPAEQELGDTDWGHFGQQSGGPIRLGRTLEWMAENGLEWRQGTRLPDNLPRGEDGEILPPDPAQLRDWYKSVPRGGRFRPDVFSHWYSTDAFSPLRWRADKPFGVVVAATLDRAVHPLFPRTLTYREAARFMSLPDTWSLRVLTEMHKPAELGKAVPTASAKWIAHWAKMSIEGTPGEYAGEDTDNPDIRVFNVQRAVDIEAIWAGRLQDAYFDDSIVSDPSPSGWLVDRKARPGEWWQREDEHGIFARRPAKVSTTAGTAPGPAPAPARTTQSAPKQKDASTIVRIQPDVVRTLLDSLGLSDKQAAEKLGVSVWRIAELTTDRRPGSWLNAARWEEVQAALRG